MDKDYSLTEAERQWTPDEEYEERLRKKNENYKEDYKDFKTARTAHEAEQAMNEVRRKLKARICAHIEATRTGDENDIFNQDHLFVEEDET